MIVEKEPIVYVVDDDPSIRRSLDDLISSAGLEVKTFSSAKDFLACDLAERPHCLILDVKMPGMTGPELQERLSALNRNVPIIFISGHGSIPLSVQAMKAGASDFLEKPYDGNVLLDAIARTLEKDIENRQKKEETTAIRERMDRLTPREREIFALITDGLLNKQIAYQLGLAEITVKIHRANIMRKMDSLSLADLVRKAEKMKEA